MALVRRRAGDRPSRGRSPGGRRSDPIDSSRTLSRAEETCDEAEATGASRPEALALDVSDPAAIDGVVCDVANRHGRIDFLVASAGIDLPRAPSVEDTTSAKGHFWIDVERETRMRIWSEETRALPFALSTLGPGAGVVGAACVPWVGGLAAI